MKNSSNVDKIDVSLVAFTLLSYIVPKKENIEKQFVEIMI